MGRNVQHDRLIEIIEEILGCGQAGLDDAFADLGGDSIQAVQILVECVREFQVDLPLESLGASTTIRELLAAVREGKTDTRQPPMPAARPGALGWARPAPRQEALYLICGQSPAIPMYNVPVALWLDGDVDTDRLRDSVKFLVERHGALRTVFRLTASGQIESTTLSAGELQWELAEPGRLLADAQEGYKWIQRLTTKPLDLHRSPFRAGLARVDGSRHVIVLVAHHAVCDGWALNILLREFVAAYAGEPPGPEPVDPGLLMARERARLDRASQEGLTQGWSSLLGGVPDLLDLPFDRPRASERDVAGARVPLMVRASVLERLRKRASEMRATPFVLLLSAFGLLLRRYSGHDDLVVGVPLANRHDVAAQGAVGYFANVVPIRIDLRGRPSLRQYVDRVGAMLSEASRLADLPLDMIISGLGLARPADRTPLFQVALTLLTNGVRPLAAPGVTVERADIGTGTAKFDQSWCLEEREDRWEGYVEFATALFDATTIERMRSHLERLLLGMTSADFDAPASSLEMFAASEKTQITEELAPNAPAVDGTVIDRFLEQVRDHASSPAIWDDGRYLSYSELHQLAGATAARLVAAGVGPERLVGVCERRMARHIADVIGVLLAGGAFLSLDPAYPAARLRSLIDDAGADFVLADPSLQPMLQGTQAALIDSGHSADDEQPLHVPVAVAPSSLACVIYTSGSTGESKGVELTHAALANVLDQSREAFGLRLGIRVPQLAPASSGPWLWEVLMALTTGGTLCLRSAGLGASEESLTELIQAASPEVMLVTPALLSVIDPADVPSVRLVITGGDRVGAELVHRWSRWARFFAAYGPTEGTIVQTWGEYRDDHGGHMPIGYPFGGVRLYVLDANLEPVPYGSVGEVYVGGMAVGRGYRRCPSLTASRFLPDPYVHAPGGRMYRTGDLVRRHADGELTFVGRLDGQVKIRGYRIELGEVQVGLQRLPDVAEAVALIDTAHDGHPRLVGYVVPAAETSETLLRTALRQRMPQHLVPTRIYLVDAIPRTANGKIAYTDLKPPDRAEHAGLSALLDQLDNMTDQAAARLAASLRPRTGRS
jgi:amino acid adenylation domain-containing protein